MQSTPLKVIVVGGGVSGLGMALVLARRGHNVTVVERDHTPMPNTADEAFEWDRRGAPQVRHSHAFLARLRNLLVSDYPDVYAALLSEGATEMRFGDDLPAEMVGFIRQPDDDELVMLACRRTTFEWVLRRAALAEGRVTFLTGVGVDGVLATRSDDAATVITGVRLADGTELVGDLEQSPLVLAEQLGLEQFAAALENAGEGDDRRALSVLVGTAVAEQRDGVAHLSCRGRFGGDENPVEQLGAGGVHDLDEPAGVLPGVREP